MIKDRDFWQHVIDLSKRNQKFVLLVVVDSDGSSPGRKGFKMLVSADGNSVGSIGGGIMEANLISKAQALIDSNDTKPQLIQQNHNKSASEKFSSGMICSGKQTVALCLISSEISIEWNAQLFLMFSNYGFDITNSDLSVGFKNNGESDWSYTECLSYSDVVYIVGGGHVGLALSKQLQNLDFYTVLLDERDDLQIINANDFTNEKHICPYADVGKHINLKVNAYVIVVTYSYPTDKAALASILKHDLKFVGLMGSKAKIKKIFAELKKEGVSKDKLEQIKAPVGLDIHSHTPAEIAVSVAAQLIRCKNK